MQPDVIGDRSPDMQKMANYWELVDALNDGIEKVREGGTKYLPKFPKETPENYKFRLQQTKMTNVFSDILESLASKPFEKPIVLANQDNVKYPEFLLEFVKDVDGAGNNISVFSTDVFEAGIRSAIDWIFCDYPNNTPGRMTIEQKKLAKIRPFWSRILAVNVLAADPIMVGGDEQLGYFRYLEPGSPNRVRELRLNVVTRKVDWKLYEKTDKYNEKEKTWYKVIQNGVMDIDEIPIAPFITGRRIGRTYQLKPPMKAAADAQLDLYHQESNLKYTKLLGAFPMLSANGVKPDKNEDGSIKPIDVAPNVVLYAPPNSDGSTGSWSYVEPNANTLMFLAKDIDSAIQNLRELGRQPLTAQSSNLTTVTTAFAAGKSKSSVAAWAGKLKDTLENLLRITLKWESITFADVNVFVYTEFDQFIEGKDLAELNAARADGQISYETYVSECKRRGFLADTVDPKVERERLLKESPGPTDDTPVTGG